MKLDRLAALMAKQKSTDQGGQVVTLKATPDRERDTSKASEGHVLTIVETKPRYLVLVNGKTSPRKDPN